MKKVLALVLAIITVLTLTVIPFTASAAEGKDPTFTADKSVVVGETAESKGYTGSNGFFAMAQGGGKKYLWDHNYAGKTINFKTQADSASVYSANSGADGELYVISYATNPRQLDFSRKGVDQIYNTAMFVHVSDTKVKVNSFLIAIPAPESILGDNVPDGFTVMVGDQKYDNSDSATSYGENAAHFTKALQVSGLVTDKKYQVSKDGSFAYYEANLDKEYEITDVAIFMSSTDRQHLVDVGNARSGSASYYFTEVALFADKIPEPQKTEEQKPADNTGDTSMLLGMILVGAVAFTASVAVIKKKEENV